MHINLHHFISLDIKDFNTSVLVKTFEADEGLQMAIQDLDIPVIIENDSINEAEQNFIVFFEIIDAVSPTSFAINRNFAICRIADDDRE